MNTWQKNPNKYTSHEVQNELLKVSAFLQSCPFITIMMDETTDVVSNREQAVLVFPSVTDDFDVFEEFLGLYEAPSIYAETLKKIM